MGNNAALKENGDRPVFVIGHKNPDTDSVCAALSNRVRVRIRDRRIHSNIVNNHRNPSFLYYDSPVKSPFSGTRYNFRRLYHNILVRCGASCPDIVVQDAEI